MSRTAAILLSITTLASALNACQKLAMCSLEKCITEKENGTRTPLQEELMEALIGRVSWGCVYGPSCYDFCIDCPACAYGMKQIRNIVVDQKSDGQCKALEKCALNCFSDQVRRRSPWECFREQCAVECFNERSCPSCYDTAKSIFAGLCYREGLNWKFKVKCRELFDKASTDLVFKRRRFVMAL